MGFLWSKPKNLLSESFLPHGSVILINTGDIILIPATDLEIVLNSDVWQGVAIALSPTAIWYNKKITPTNVFLRSHQELCIRQLHCTRPSGFKEKFEQAIRFAENIVDILLEMGFIDDVENITPLHFSSNSPYTCVQLPMYSENMYL